MVIEQLGLSADKETGREQKRIVNASLTFLASIGERNFRYFPPSVSFLNSIVEADNIISVRPLAVEQIFSQFSMYWPNDKFPTWKGYLENV